MAGGGGGGGGVCVLHGPICFFMGPVFNDLFWGGSFRFTEKLRGRCREFSNTLHPYTWITSNIFNGLQPEVIFDEPTLTHRNHLTTMAYMRTHSWCFTFCGFEQVYGSMCSSQLCHTVFCWWWSCMDIALFQAVSLPWKSSVLCLFILAPLRQPLTFLLSP